MTYIILQSAFWISGLIVSVFFVHMLQLESYQLHGYWRWLKDKADAAALRLLPALLIVVLSVMFQESWVPWAASGLFALTLLLSVPRRKAKRPLKFTARAIRLLIVQGLVLAGASFLAVCVGKLQSSARGLWREAQRRRGA